MRPIGARSNIGGAVAMPPSRHILSFGQYAALRHPTPYLVEVRRGGSRLLLFGGAHSTDPAQPMFNAIEAAFERLAPTYALHEGTPPALEREREIAIRRHGESGLVVHLAARAGIETASMDIALPDEARYLQQALGTPRALVFLVVRQLASFNRKTARMDFDGYFGDFFSLIAPPLGLAAIEWPMIETAHLAVLGTPLAARQVTGVETDPLRSELLTQRIARHSNRRRDDHMLERLVAAMDAHSRVFATVGVTHAVMLEPALRRIHPRPGRAGAA